MSESASTACTMLSPSDALQVETETREWLQRAVIGLNLCPFAKAVLVKGQIHFQVSQAHSAEELFTDLEQALQALHTSDPLVRDTTLLMLPLCLQDFAEFNDFLVLADQVLAGLRLRGVLQIASFHPDYQFDGVAAQDISNFTNRAPYPTLHLLREASLDRAVAAFPQAEMIFEDNVRTLESLGHHGWQALGVGRGKIGP